MLTILTALTLTLLTPCPTEDSAQCTWYAQAQGITGGHTFVSVTEDLVIYVD